MKHGARVSDFHIIGHSLGSHIAGYAGERLIERGVGKLGRISGLDPAEPLFQNMPEFVRLDPGDAEFVDAIHTDAKSILMFGTRNSSHHLLTLRSDSRRNKIPRISNSAAAAGNLESLTLGFGVLGQ